MLGLLTAAVPLKYIATSTVLAIPAGEEGSIIVDPTPAEAEKAQSLHCLGFTSDDELLLMESDGSFSVDQWKKVMQTAERVCCQRGDADADTAMGEDGVQSSSIRDFVRSVMETKTAADLHWK